MNYVWCFMIIVSLIYSFFNGTVEQTFAAATDAAAKSVEVVLSFAGIMCLWSGVLQICDASGISGIIKKALSPLLGLLFRNLSDESAKNLITMNITANLLGMGNAATPSGIAAMKRLDEINGKKISPSYEMCVFTVLNTCALSFVPSTVIAMLSGAGSQNPTAIIVPVWIVSVISLCAGLIAVRLLCRR